MQQDVTPLLKKGLPGLQLFYEIQGPFHEGINLIQLTLARLPGNGKEKPFRCALLLAESSLQTRLGQLDKAVIKAEQALALAQTTLSATLTAEADLALGIAFIRLARYQEAHTRLTAAYEQALEVGANDIAAASLHHLGNMAYARRDIPLAEDQYEQAADLYASQGMLLGASTARHNVALIRLEQGKPDEAQALFLQVLADFQKISYQQGIASSLHNLGLVAQQQGRIGEGIQYFEEALAIRRKIGDQAGTAFTLSNLAYLLKTTGDQIGADGYAAEALTLARQTGDQRTACHAQQVLGETAVERGYFTTARVHFHQILEVTMADGLRLEEARARRGLGWSAIVIRFV